MRMRTSLFVVITSVGFSMLGWAQHGAGPNGGGIGHGANGTNHGSKGSDFSRTHGMTVDEKLSRNTVLSDKIQTLTGMPAQQACSGFKNVGQCVAAAHVSKNLGISFACMQADMTGQAPAQGSSCPTGSGTKSLSLGKSIQTLSPNVNAKVESKRASKQAHADIADSAAAS